MKEKISVKDLKEIIVGNTVLKTNNLDVVLHQLNADYYLTRAEGWRCDIYVLPNENIVLIDGYDTIDYIRGKKIPYNLCKKYNEIFREKKKSCLNHMGYFPHEYNTTLALDLIKQIADKLK